MGALDAQRDPTLADELKAMLSILKDIREVNILLRAEYG